MSNSKDTILGLFPDNVNNEIKAADLRTFVTSVFDEEVDTNEIQDNLISTSTDKPLSAYQGNILNTRITSEIAAVGIAKEDAFVAGTDNQVLTSLSGNKIWTTLNIPTEVIVINDLTTGGTTDALSAQQGVVLNSLISSNDADILSNFNAIASNDSDILDLQGVDTAFNIRITDNFTNIGTNDDDILALQNADGVLDGKIEANTDNIELNDDDILALQTAAGLLSGRVTVNEGNITTLQGSIGVVDVTALEVRVSDNETNIGLNDDDILALQTEDGVLDGKIEANTDNIDLNDIDILALQNADIALDGRVTVNEGNITTIQNNIGVVDVTALEVRVGNTETQTGINTGNIDTNSGLIGGNTSAISGLTGSISNNTDAIGVNTSSISTVSGRVDTLETRVGLTNSTGLSLQIETNRLDIIDINTYVGTDISSGLSLQVETNRLSIIDNDGDISDLIGNLSTLENGKVQDNIDDILALQTDTTLSDRVTINEGAIGDLDGRVSDNETNIGTNDDDILALQTANGLLDERMDVVEVDLNSNELQAAANTAAIALLDGSGVVSIDDLNDVNTSTILPNTGELLEWDGTTWIPGGAENIMTENGDIIITETEGGLLVEYILVTEAPIDGVLYVRRNGNWEEMPASNITGSNIEELNNVYTSMSPTDGQVLTFDTTNGWQAETPTAGGAGVWGTITGTLSNQTDLQNALNTKSNTGHLHTGVYEPIDATILRSANIGNTVQGYDTGTVIDATYVATEENYTTTEKSKLSGIEALANAYVHPDTDGSKHVPANSTTHDGDVLTAGTEAGTYTWETPSGGGTTLPVDKAVEAYNIASMTYGTDGVTNITYGQNEDSDTSYEDWYSSYTYTSGDLTQIVYYNDSAVVQLTITYTYSGGNLATVTRS